MSRSHNVEEELLEKCQAREDGWGGRDTDVVETVETRGWWVGAQRCDKNPDEQRGIKC